MRKQALAAALIALVAGGCGSARKQPPPSSLAAFLAAANEICARATTPGGRVARLRALRPPPDAVDLYTRWMLAEEDALDAGAALREPPDPDGLDPGVSFAIAEGKVVGYARRLGAETCAKRTIGTMPR